MVKHFEYIDDIYIHVAPDVLPQAWPLLIEVLRRRRVTPTMRKMGA